MKSLFLTIAKDEPPRRLKSHFLLIPRQKYQLFFALALVMITSRVPAQNDTLSSQHQKNMDTENALMKTLTKTRRRKTGYRKPKSATNSSYCLIVLIFHY